MVDNYSPGQTVTMTVKRAGQTQNIKVKLGTRPAATRPAADTTSEPGGASARPAGACGGVRRSRPAANRRRRVASAVARAPNAITRDQQRPEGAGAEGVASA